MSNNLESRTNVFKRFNSTDGHDRYTGLLLDDRPLRTDERTVIMREIILKEDGPLPSQWQETYDRARYQTTYHRAMIILDRWRFANQPREEQLREFEIFSENHIQAFQEGVVLGAHPMDLVDLIKPDNEFVYNFDEVPALPSHAAFSQE